jgi:hypothetical protein
MEALAGSADVDAHDGGNQGNGPGKKVILGGGNTSPLRQAPT